MDTLIDRGTGIAGFHQLDDFERQGAEVGHKFVRRTTGEQIAGT